MSNNYYDALINTCKLKVISNSLNTNDIEIINVVLQLSEQHLNEHVLVVNPTESMSHSYFQNFADILLCELASVNYQCYEREIVNQFIEKHNKFFKSEYLLCQFHSHLPFQIPIPIISYPSHEVCEGTQKLYVDLQMYLSKNLKDELDLLITYDMLFCISQKASLFAFEQDFKPDIISSAMQYQQLIAEQQKQAIQQQAILYDELRSWQGSDEGQLAVQMYKRNQPLKVSQKGKGTLLHPPDSVMARFCMDAPADEDTVNALTNYSVGFAFGTTEVTNESYFTFSLLASRSNYFHMSYAGKGGFLALISILQNVLQKSEHNEVDKLLITECYNCTILYFFYSDIPLQELNDIFENAIRIEQSTMKAALIENQRAERGEIGYLFPRYLLSMFSDVAFLELLILLAQQGNSRLIISSPVFPRLIDTEQKLETSTYFYTGLENISKILYCLDAIENSDKIAMEFGLRPFASECLVNWKGYKILNVRNLLFTKICENCENLSIWDSFVTGWRAIGQV